MRIGRLSGGIGAVILFFFAQGRADEGMWLLDQFPRDLVKSKYGIALDNQTLDHFRLSAARFNNGGTASFVSATGLLFTNHHVGADCIQKLSTEKDDLMAKGFLAASLQDERRCPDLEVNVLLKTENVTAKVNEGVAAGTAPAEANRVRKANMSALEQACLAATGNRCDVVTLYSGGQYHLYQYKKYTDVRLVMAPEFGIAFFGGDPDNFEYPRYCLDIAFFRAYENGQPAHTPQHFRWSKTGVRDGDVIFVPGHPGTTDRLATLGELEFVRDVQYPMVLGRLNTLIASLEKYGAQGAEQRRQAQDLIFGVSNSSKAMTGQLRGLRDAELMQTKREAEKKIRAAMTANPAEREKNARFWDELATAWQDYRGAYPRVFAFERTATLGSEYLRLARQIVRYTAETRKPNAERLREFSEAGLASLQQSMYSPAPIYDGVEQVGLTCYFEFLLKQLGPADPAVNAVLAGRTPAQAAAYYLGSTKLKDIAERKRLAGDPEAIKASSDGMIRLALLLDAEARKWRKHYEDKIEAVVRGSAAEIARARFSMSGASEYPDATFTLRLAYGQVKGYTDRSGSAVPWSTKFSGLYAKGTGKDPYIIPPGWLERRAALKQDTPFNFVATADIHGGNSGSATVNAQGEVVGIIFDSNIDALPNRYIYSEKQARSVHVASQGIVEALRTVYRAGRVLKELRLAE